MLLKPERRCLVVLEARSDGARAYVEDAEEQQELLFAEDDGLVRAARAVIKFLRGRPRLRVVACSYQCLGARKEAARECGAACAMIGAEVARRGAA
jgi:hypothetical protein